MLWLFNIEKYMLITSSFIVYSREFSLLTMIDFLSQHNLDMHKNYIILIEPWLNLFSEYWIKVFMKTLLVIRIWEFTHISGYFNCWNFLSADLTSNLIWWDVSLHFSSCRLGIRCSYAEAVREDPSSGAIDVVADVKSERVLTFSFSPV